MSLIMIIGIVLLGVIVLPISMGIKAFGQRRWVAVLLFLIPAVTIAFISSFMHSLFYTTTPEVLELQVEQQEEKFFISGVWKRKYESYASGTDYIAIYTAENVHINETDMRAFSINGIEERYRLNDLKRALEKNPNYDAAKRLHLFEVKLEKEFNVYFQTTPQVTVDDFVVQYIHVYSPPMDLFLYWVKTVNGEIDDPMDMYR